MRATAQPAPADTGLPAADELAALAALENFVVAPRILGKDVRRHLNAVYAFARGVDTLGDEFGGDRPAALDWLEAEVARAYDGEARHPLLVEVGRTIHELDLPRGPFLRLIQANRRDQVVRDYATYDELRDYCTFSADPVGELVLHVFGAASPETVALSNHVCSALQLVEHWQDVGEDARRGRVYLPREDRERFEVTRDDLLAPAASERLRALLAFECERASELLSAGAPLVGRLRGRARLAVAAYVGGGRSALDALRSGRYEVLPRAPRPRPSRRLLRAAAAYGSGR